MKKIFQKKPLIDIAVLTEDGPGNGVTSIELLMHSLIIMEPGSEIEGVPASEIRDITKPFFNKPIILGKFFFH